MIDYEKILKACDGPKVTETQVEQSRYGGRREPYNRVDVEFPDDGVIAVPPGIFIEINSSATEGTIGELIGIQNASTYSGTYILRIDGRPKPCRIHSSYAALLIGHDGTTKFCRNVNSHPKVHVQNPVNKYKQELKKGDWIIGVGMSKTLVIGTVSRWTNHNVWAFKNGEKKEVKLDCIEETFLMPNTEHVKSLTWAALKGYTG